MKPLTIGIVVVAVLVILSVLGVYFVAVPLDVQRLEADITLENRAAFKLTNDSILHFGSIDTDQESTRTVVIENIRTAPITATVYIDGPDWVSVSENPIRLQPSQARNVTFTADPPLDASYGNYSWNISIVYRRW